MASRRRRRPTRAGAVKAACAHAHRRRSGASALTAPRAPRDTLRRQRGRTFPLVTRAGRPVGATRRWREGRVREGMPATGRSPRARGGWPPASTSSVNTFRVRGAPVCEAHPAKQVGLMMEAGGVGGRTGRSPCSTKWWRRPPRPTAHRVTTRFFLPCSPVADPPTRGAPRSVHPRVSDPVTTPVPCGVRQRVATGPRGGLLALARGRRARVRWSSAEVVGTPVMARADRADPRAPRSSTRPGA